MYVSTLVVMFARLTRFDQDLSSPRRNSRSTLTLNTHRRSAATYHHSHLVHHSSQQTASLSLTPPETIREQRGNAN